MSEEYDSNEFLIKDLYDVKVAEYESERERTDNFKYWDEEETGCTPEEYAESLFGDLRRGQTYVLYRYDGNSEDVVIPRGVTAIDSQVFRKKDFVRRVYVPDSVVRVGSAVFEYCTALEEVRLSDELRAIGWGAFRGCKALKHVYLGKNLSVIGFDTFRDCVALESIDLPRGLEKIHDGAFYGTGLKDVFIPRCVNELSGEAFSHCNDLESIEIAPTNPFYRSANNCIFDVQRGWLVFGSNDGTLPDDGSFTVIDEDAFNGNLRVTELIVPDGVDTIRASAFHGCKNLRFVSFPDTLANIAPCAFEGCKALEEVTVPGSVQKVSRFAFADSGIKRAVFKRGVRELDENLFFKCAELSELYIPSSVKKLYYSTLCDCSKSLKIYIEGGEENYKNYIEKLSKFDVVPNCGHELFD